MDFFDVFPQFRTMEDPSLHNRSLRLLNLAGIPYDADAYYFELSASRYWVQPHGAERVTIGVGGVQIRLAGRRPLQALLSHVRESWGGVARFLPTGKTYLLDGERMAVVSADDHQERAAPHMLILTPPRLGGPNMPDALVQAVYFLALEERPQPRETPGLLRVEQQAMATFLEMERWAVDVLHAQPWATLHHTGTLPENAALRPVLALRGARRLQKAGLLSLVDRMTA